QPRRRVRQSRRARASPRRSTPTHAARSGTGLVGQTSHGHRVRRHTSHSMIGGALALVASLFLGVSDFLGGVLSRRLPLVTVLLLSQAVATTAILTTMLWNDPLTGLGGAALWGIIGGIATAIGVSALYAALAIGTMGVVAPITALSVLVPVSAGVIGGDQLGWLLIGGIVLAIVGTIMSSGPEFSRREAGHGPKPIILGLISALGFGFANVSVAWGSAFNVT